MPAHPAAHGFVIGRSVKSFTELHVNRPVVIAMDLRHFFLTIRPGQVVRLFQRLGYEPAVSRALAGLCLNSTPEQELQAMDCVETRKLYRHPHLPQGAPTSPILANLLAYHLDCRLEGAAMALGFCYSRYADDLAFSSHQNNGRDVNALKKWVNTIVREEGFALNTVKTRVMSAARCQRLAGVVVNRKQSLPKAEIKRMEAILFNCVRYGPTSQNREAHPDFRAWMEGKLAYIRHLAPHHFERLDRHYRQIQW